MKGDAHYVYFIRPVGAEGPVKIGCSQCPLERLSGLMDWSPVPLEVVATIPGYFDLERNIQECFLDQRSHREWFHASARLTELMEALRGGAKISDVLDLNDRRGRIGNGRVYTDAHRLYLSYVHRLSKIGSRRCYANYHVSQPEDVRKIISRWSGWGQRPRRQQVPTPEEFARLDEVLANPDLHFHKQLIRGRKPQQVAA